jgi:hypothetical protein
MTRTWDGEGIGESGPGGPHAIEYPGRISTIPGDLFVDYLTGIHQILSAIYENILPT